MRFPFTSLGDSLRAPLSPHATMDEMRDLESFRNHAAALEAQIAAAEAAGDEVPAEAKLILASLRDLATAVDGLRTTMTETDAAGGATSPDHKEG